MVAAIPGNQGNLGISGNKKVVKEIRKCPEKKRLQ